MRIGSPSQAHNPQANRWNVPDMDSDSSAIQQNHGNTGNQKNIETFAWLGDKKKQAELDAMKAKADKMNGDFYRIMTDQGALENDMETYKNIFALDSKGGLGKEFQKLVAEMQKAARIENQQPEQPQNNFDQDGFEATSPQNAWRAFSGQ